MRLNKHQRICFLKGEDMTLAEIENYLSEKHSRLDESIEEQIEMLRQDAINAMDEEKANYCWCIRHIYRIQKGFISAINALKSQKYEDAWCILEEVDIGISNFENNFDVSQQNDKYHLLFVKKIIPEYQKLFPYRYFFSRECVIKKEECSICGKEISLRQRCGHKTGKLYMGELCLRNVTDMEFKAVSIVTDPFDKYTYLKLPNKEYNYGMLDHLMAEVDSPYEDFYIETIKVKNDEYKNIGRNDLCPCGSGKKYKKCHLGKNGELIDHHIIHMKKKKLCANKYVGTFGTWK